MPSHLTKAVFRRLLANEPLVHRGCLRRRQYSALTSWGRTVRNATLHHGRSVIPHSQRRTFFNFNLFSKKSDVREAEMDPGIDKMMELAKRERMSARMPPLEDVALALKQFFDAKRLKRQGITDTQAQLVLQSLRYYQATVEQIDAGDEVDGGSPLLREDMYSRMAAVLRQCRSSRPAHVALSRVLFDTLRSASSAFTFDALRTHVRLCAMLGTLEEAQELVLQWEHDTAGRASIQPPPTRAEDMEEDAERNGQSATHESLQNSKLWAWLLWGYVRHNNRSRVEQTIAVIQSRGFPDNILTVAAMVEWSLRSGDTRTAIEWWRRAERSHNMSNVVDFASFATLFDQILKWCLEHQQLEVGHALVREVMVDSPPKGVWDAVLVWAAGTKRSVDEIGRMMDVMEESNKTLNNPENWRRPDNRTINKLVKFAISKNDPYMAERFITLGRERNIEPNARTYVLQIDYRLSVGDVDGALIAYKALAEHQDTDAAQSIDNVEVAAINRLIVALCGTQRHDFETIMNVTMDLADRRARFTPETVSTLALLHLNRDESDDATDLLHTHVFHFSSDDRTHVRNTIINYTLDPSTPTARAWQSYSILRDVFDETNRDERTQVMTSFFNRGRVDAAVRVFQHMRAHSRADTIPNIDTYVACLLGLAKCREVESLEVVYNLLVLDYNIDVNTYLRNALMIAYTACGKGRKALGFWDDIVTSKEGPSYNSIHIALRACEKSPFGDIRAQELWALLQRRNVEPDQALWASYIAALAGNGDNRTAIHTVEEAERKGEMEVDSFVLASLCDAAVGHGKQEEIEAWAKEKYPVQWRKVEEIGWEEIYGRRSFRIDRRVAP